ATALPRPEQQRRRRRPSRDRSHREATKASREREASLLMPGGNVASEHDACALVAITRKDARPTREVLELVLHGMASLAHRSGVVDGEGDGAGVLTDIPRALWAHELERTGRDETAVQLERFAVGHFFHDDADDVKDIVAILAGRGIETLLARTETTDEAALGPRGRNEAPRSLQLAL